jgi:hypothetical protein
MRFTIRDLFWLTVVVALGLAWWIDRSWLARGLATMTEEVHFLRQHRQGGNSIYVPDIKTLTPNPSALAPNPPKD